MSEMIERVARALWSKAKDEPTRRSVGFSFENDPLRLWWIDQARAAIEAMREPTDRMKMEFEGWNCSANDMEAGYQAAIDAALKETV
ncbi:hypothetical protein [Agrobacterium tumefaciens]|uniref:hypothetical protein n=1 Tax=Agrobacterium tumefaciens TaxID=358 RepID=UPI003BA2BA48